MRQTNDIDDAVNDVLVMVELNGQNEESFILDNLIISFYYGYGWSTSHIVSGSVHLEVYCLFRSSLVLAIIPSFFPQNSFE